MSRPVVPVELTNRRSCFLSEVRGQSVVQLWLCECAESAVLTHCCTVFYVTYWSHSSAALLVWHFLDLFIRRWFVSFLESTAAQSWTEAVLNDVNKWNLSRCIRINRPELINLINRWVHWKLKELRVTEFKDHFPVLAQLLETSGLLSNLSSFTTT